MKKIKVKKSSQYESRKPIGYMKVYLERCSYLTFSIYIYLKNKEICHINFYDQHYYIYFTNKIQINKKCIKAYLNEKV